jgi:hypothetical protein
MPYTCDPGSPEPVYVGIYGDYTVDFDIGVDEDNAEQIVMTVALVEDEESGSDPFEIVFGIRSKHLIAGTTGEPSFDHATARKFVPKEHAAAVMDLVLDSLTMLVEHVNPSTVTMATYESDLNVAAMAKYMRISNHMGTLGYRQTQYRRDGTDLKDYWLFTK